MRILDVPLRRFFWPWWKLLIIIFLVVLPMCQGYWLWYLIGTNVGDRFQALQQTSTLKGIQYTDEQYPLDVETEQGMQFLQREIIDSIEPIIPVSHNHLLPTYELRIQRVQGTNLTAFLFHCRLWCDCREDLSAGSFQLMVFQLNPHASSYTLVADTVMTYEDYVKPFTLKLP